MTGSPIRISAARRPSACTKCVGVTTLENDPWFEATPVTRSAAAPLNPHDRSLAPRHRVARSGDAGRADEAPLPSHGGDVAGRHARSLHREPPVTTRTSTRAPRARSPRSPATRTSCSRSRTTSAARASCTSSGWPTREPGIPISRFSDQPAAVIKQHAGCDCGDLLRSPQASPELTMIVVAPGGRVGGTKEPEHAARQRDGDGDRCDPGRRHALDVRARLTQQTERGQRRHGSADRDEVPDHRVARRARPPPAASRRTGTPSRRGWGTGAARRTARPRSR